MADPFVAFTSLVPLTSIVKPSTSDQMQLSHAFNFASLSVRVLVFGSYFTVPSTPSITERSPQLPEVTCVPQILRSYLVTIGSIFTSLVTFSPLSTTAFFDSSNSAPAGCVIAQSSSVISLKSQIEPSFPSAVTVAFLISNFSVEPSCPAMPYAPLSAFTVQLLMVRLVLFA